MRCTMFLLSALLVLSLLGSGSPREYDDRVTQADDLDGTWQLEGGTTVMITCHRGTWSFEGSGLLWHGTYSIDPNRTPARLEWHYTDGPHNGNTFRFIYEIKGDVLRFGYLPNDSRFPQGFDDKGIIVTTYKRAKK
jgi:uncharacterized protein (TIGR03067 family)